MPLATAAERQAKEKRKKEKAFLKASYYLIITTLEAGSLRRCLYILMSLLQGESSNFGGSFCTSSTEKKNHITTAFNSQCFPGFCLFAYPQPQK